MLITILDVQLFCPRIGISTDPLLIIWRVETFAWTLSFVESIINEKGSKPSYGCQSLSLIPSVSVATSQRCSGDLETIVRVISFCVMKCLAISLTLVKSRVNILSIESCDSTGGVVGVTIGCVGSIGVTTGRDGVVIAPVDGIVEDVVGVCIIVVIVVGDE